MTLPPLKLAVVGHTNTGKTSLLRTLTRDECFGDVSDRPATTRHVQAATLLVNGRPLIELYDTPGLEDSIALLEHLDSIATPDRRADSVHIIQQFLNSPLATDTPTTGGGGGARFSQEAKALRQVLASDAALYVIDARDRVLGKHHDELEILSRCAKPIIPVLNFTATAQGRAQAQVWREHLARVNMHVVAEFDTVVIDDSSERLLLEKVRTVLDRHQATLGALIEDRARQRAQIIQASADLIADLLIDAAAYAAPAPINNTQAAALAVEKLKQRLRQREQECVEQLLRLHRFSANDLQQDHELPIVHGRWGTDLFSPAAMKQFGVRAGGGAAAGALAGLTLDAMVGGLSLGAATAVGAAIGALFGAGHMHGRRLIDRARGQAELRCDDVTLQLLMVRQISLVRALLRRGHASLQPIRLADQRGEVGNQKSEVRDQTARSARGAIALPPELDEARIRPQWSRLAERSDPMALASPARRTVQDAITQAISARIGVADKGG